MTSLNPTTPPLDLPAQLRQLFLHVGKVEPADGVWKTLIETMAPEDPTFWTTGVIPFHQRLLNRSSKLLPMDFWRSLGNKYGSAIFTARDKDGIDLARMFFLGTRGTHSGKGPVDHNGVLGRTAGVDGQEEAHAIAAFLMEVLPRPRILEILDERRQIMENAGLKEVAGMTMEELKDHPILPLAILINDQFVEAAGVLVKRFPEFRQARLGRNNAASMMIGSDLGWSAYLTSGGTLADPVWRDIRTDEETTVPMSVGEWIFGRGALPPQAHRDITRAMERMKANEAPKDGEFSFDNASFVIVQENNKELGKQIRVRAFEKDLLKDWREALRSNKNWRSWRSTDGATVMHMLAVYSPYAFFQRAGTRVNSKLTHLIDTNGDSIIPYVLIGAATGGDYGHGSVNKVSQRRETGYLQVCKDLDDILSQTPQRGVMVSLIEGHKTSFIGGMTKARATSVCLSRGVEQILMTYPQWLWAGWTEDTTRTLFSSPDRIKQVEWVMSSLAGPVFNGSNTPGSASSIDDGAAQTIRKQLEQQPFYIRLAFAVLFTQDFPSSHIYRGSQSGQGSSGHERLSTLVNRVAEETLESCPTDIARGALNVIETFRGRLGYRANTYPQLEAALERVVLLNRDASTTEKKTVDETKIDENKKKRRM